MAGHRSSLLYASGSSYVSKHDAECEDAAVKDMKSFDASVRNGGRCQDLINCHAEESNMYKLHKIVPSDSHVRTLQILNYYFFTAYVGIKQVYRSHCRLMTIIGSAQMTMSVHLICGVRHILSCHEFTGASELNMQYDLLWKIAK